MTGTRRDRRGLSIGPNWSGWSKSNSRLAPSRAQGTKRTGVWLQAGRKEPIERSFGSMQRAGSKSNGRLAPCSVQGANRTVFWLHAACMEQIERSFGSMQCAWGKSNGILATQKKKE